MSAAQLAAATNRRLVKFIVAAVLFFAWGIIQGALQEQKPIHEFLMQGPQPGKEWAWRNYKFSGIYLLGLFVVMALDVLV